ncbi:MAG: hypothetical protein JNK64_12425 [Myxococcales bacterium]|nr:hypothetical protein [Myxococcales bacterium]
MVSRGAWVIAALALAAGGAAADEAAVASHLAAAQRARAALRYDAALDEVARALAAGDATPAQVAALYRLGGELAAGLDRPDEAAAWFARWLTVEPAGALPAGASPKLAAALEAARAQASPLALTARRAGDAIVATVGATVGATAGVVRAIRVAADPRARGVDGGVGQPLPWPRGQAAVVIALDEHGNHLAYAAVPVAARRGGGTPSTPLHRRWQPYAGVALGCGVLGGVFAWRTAVAQDEFDALRADPQGHPLDVYEAVRARGERNALIANLGFAGAGAFAVVAAIVWWQRPQATTLAIEPSADGGAVTLRGQF